MNDTIASGIEKSVCKKSPFDTSIERKNEKVSVIDSRFRKINGISFTKITCGVLKTKTQECCEKIGSLSEYWYSSDRCQNFLKSAEQRC